MNVMLCCGLGYSLRPVAAQLAGSGWEIVASSRSAGGVEAIRAAGYRGELFAPVDGIAALHQQKKDLLETVTHILVSAPPEDYGDPLLEHHMADLACAPRLAWIGYLSSLGVYGDHDGAWVDETTPARPASQRARRRLAAEENWLAFGDRTGRSVAVLRLAGIYGPGRSAIDTLADGTAKRIVKPGQVFNRIHVDDIATAILAALRQPEKGGIFNICDDEPAPPQDVVTYAAELMGVEPPPAIDFDEALSTPALLSPMARSFYEDCKRVRNDKMKRDLGVKLAYPTYRDGLAAIAGQTRPRSG